MTRSIVISSVSFSSRDARSWRFKWTQKCAVNSYGKLSPLNYNKIHLIQVYDVSKHQNQRCHVIQCKGMYQRPVCS